MLLVVGGESTNHFRMRVLSFDMGTRNLAFALVDAPHSILRLGIIDMQTNVARLATERLLEALGGEHAWMTDASIDEYVVELQPSNSASKILSFVLMTHFHRFGSRPFRFMAAANKFKFMPDVYAQRAPETYDDRKRTAMAMAEIVLARNNDADMLAFYRGQAFKQQNDLADALVQACRHIQDSSSTTATKKTTANKKNIARSQPE